MKIRLILILLSLHSFQINVYPSESEIRPFPFKFYNSCKNLFGNEKYKKCSLGIISKEELNSAILKDPNNRRFYEAWPFYKKELRIELFEDGFYRSKSNSVMHMSFQLYTNTDSQNKDFNFSLTEDAWDCSRNYYLSRVIARGSTLDKMKFLKTDFKQYDSFSKPDAMPLCNR